MPTDKTLKGFTPAEIELMKTGLMENINILLKSRRIYPEKEIIPNQNLLKKIEDLT